MEKPDMVRNLKRKRSRGKSKSRLVKYQNSPKKVQIKDVSLEKSVVGEETENSSKNGEMVKRRLIKRLTKAIGKHKMSNLVQRGKLPELGLPENFNIFNRTGRRAGTFIQKKNLFSFSKKMDNSVELTRENAMEIVSKP